MKETEGKEELNNCQSNSTRRSGSIRGIVTKLYIKHCHGVLGVWRDGESKEYQGLGDLGVWVSRECLGVRV